MRVTLSPSGRCGIGRGTPAGCSRRRCWINCVPLAASSISTAFGWSWRFAIRITRLIKSGKISRSRNTSSTYTLALTHECRDADRVVVEDAVFGGAVPREHDAITTPPLEAPCRSVLNQSRCTRAPPAGMGACWYWALNAAEPMEARKPSRTSRPSRLSWRRSPTRRRWGGSPATGISFVNLGDRREAQQIPTAGLQQMTGEVVFMESLHDQHGD